MMQKHIPLLLLSAVFTYAENAETLAFTGLYGSSDVDVATTKQYVECLQGEWLSRNAFKMISQESIQEALNNGECDVDCGNEVGADLVVSGSLSTTKFGYLVSLNLLEVSSGKLERIDWNVIGTKKDLMKDGCVNGAGVVYNYDVTPRSAIKVALPTSATNAEQSRDKGLRGGSNYESLHVKSKENAKKAGAAAAKNPAQDAGGEKGGR